MTGSSPTRSDRRAYEPALRVIEAGRVAVPDGAARELTIAAIEARRAAARHRRSGEPALTVVIRSGRGLCRRGDRHSGEDDDYLE